MSTLVKAAEAARILGVSKATLYAYVSRGRVGRSTAADGRTSLFALDELEALAARGRRSQPVPRPTIDVQIASAITAFVSVKWLLGYIQTNRFTAFAVYRVLFGGLLFALILTGWVN